MTGGLSIPRGCKVFEEALSEAGYNKRTIAVKLIYLRELYAYLEGRGIEDLRNVDRPPCHGRLRSVPHDPRPCSNSPANSPAHPPNVLERRAGLLPCSLRAWPHPRSPDVRPHPCQGSPRSAARHHDRRRGRPLPRWDRPFRLLRPSRPRTLRAHLLLGPSGGASRLAPRERRGSFRAALFRVRMSKFSKDRIVPITENAASYLSDLIEARALLTRRFFGAPRSRRSPAQASPAGSRSFSATSRSSSGIPRSRRPYATLRRTSRTFATVDDAYRANLTELQERLTKAAHKRAVVQARKTRQLLAYRKED